MVRLSNRHSPSARVSACRASERPHLSAPQESRGRPRPTSAPRSVHLEGSVSGLLPDSLTPAVKVLVAAKQIHVVGLLAAIIGVASGYCLLIDPVDVADWFATAAAASVSASALLWIYFLHCRRRVRRAYRTGSLARNALVELASRTYFAWFLAHQFAWVAMGLGLVVVLALTLGPLAIGLMLGMMFVTGSAFALFALGGAGFHSRLALCALTDSTALPFGRNAADIAFRLDRRYAHCRGQDDQMFLADLAATLARGDVGAAHLPDVTSTPGQNARPELRQRALGFGWAAAYGAPLAMLVLVLDFPGASYFAGSLADAIPGAPFTVGDRPTAKDGLSKLPPRPGKPAANAGASRADASERRAGGVGEQADRDPAAPGAAGQGRVGAGRTQQADAGSPAPEKAVAGVATAGTPGLAPDHPRPEGGRAAGDAESGNLGPRQMSGAPHDAEGQGPVLAENQRATAPEEVGAEPRPGADGVRRPGGLAGGAESGPQLRPQDQPGALQPDALAAATPAPKGQSALDQAGPRGGEGANTRPAPNSDPQAGGQLRADAATRTAQLDAVGAAGDARGGGITRTPETAAGEGMTRNDGRGDVGGQAVVVAPVEQRSAGAAVDDPNVLAGAKGGERRDMALPPTIGDLEHQPANADSAIELQRHALVLADPSKPVPPELGAAQASRSPPPDALRQVLPPRQALPAWIADLLPQVRN